MSANSGQAIMQFCQRQKFHMQANLLTVENLPNQFAVNTLAW